MARPNDLAHLGDLGHSAEAPSARRLGAVWAQRGAANDPRGLLERKEPSWGARKVWPDLPRRRCGGQWHACPGFGLRGAEAEGEAAAVRPPSGPTPKAAPASMQDHTDGSGRGCWDGRPHGCCGERDWHPGRLHPGCARRTAGTRRQVPAKPRAARRSRWTAEVGRDQPRPGTKRPERRRSRHQPRPTGRRRDCRPADHLAHDPHGPPAPTHPD